MTQTSQMSIGAFLDALAAKQSTPGGGGVAALSGAQAAALVSMVINFTLGKKKYADVEELLRSCIEESDALRSELTDLADQDVVAFKAVSACYGMPKETDDEKAARTTAMQAALKRATIVPFTIAERALAVMTLIEPVGAKANKNVISDAATALYLADAAIHSALLNVNINLKFIKDAAFVAEWSQRRDVLLVRATTAYDAGRSACEQTLGLGL